MAEKKSLASQRARIAALALHSQVDGKEHTAAARAKFMERFEREVDPESLLDLAERQRRAAIAKRRHFLALALKSVQARARGRGEAT